MTDQTYDGTIRVINVWKRLKRPVLQNPLVLCDSRTCVGDGLATDLVYPHAVSENLMFGHSKDQRWYYIDKQDDNETWLIKIMDSASKEMPNIAEYTAHTSFKDSDPALADEIRVSIEFRVYVFG